MKSTMLAVAEANTMVADFKSGLRQAGWLYKLVGKSPQDVNWKKYWVGPKLNSILFKLNQSQSIDLCIELFTWWQQRSVQRRCSSR